MYIPKQEDYAVLFMSELSRVYGKRLLPVSEVAKVHGVSPLYLKKIVRLLRKAKLVASKEGVDGGYSLAKDPKYLSVWDVISAVGKHKHTDISVQSKTRICPLYSACLPQHIKKIIALTLEKSMRKITLVNLIR